MSARTPQHLSHRHLRLAVCSLQFAVALVASTFAAAAHAQPTNSLIVEEEAALRAAADAVAPSVVQIRTIGGLDEFEGKVLAEGPTTGLVISPDGYILSSAFNFMQQPASILVTLPSGKQAPADLVATDHSRMLVLLKVAGVADLPVPTLAPAAEVRPGQWAIAMGRTFRTDRVNLSVGIVSAVGRMFGKAVQTDADVSTACYGGPLVDIHGRVQGIIVPMAPQGSSEVAGAEWYDSGIGFAVPLEPLADAIERMKKGEDQRPGLLGIGLAAKNPHTAAAEFAVVRPDSPAGKAGFKKGDRVVEVDGKTIKTQNDLRFALGPHYAGESVKLVAMRGDGRLEQTLELIGELPPFRHAFLGILPMRTADATSDDEADENDADDTDNDENPASDLGIVVRLAFPGSPAEEAGIQAGDRIERINETEIRSLQDVLDAMNNVSPGSEVKLAIRHGEETKEITLTAARISATVPTDLPTAFAAAEKDSADPKAGETREVKLPEFPNACKVYVPSSTDDADRPLAAIFWLHPAGESDADEVIRQWKSICDRDGALLIVPTSGNKNSWDRTELEYLSRLVIKILADFKIDRQRVVVYGQEGGGSMAWLLGLSARNVFHGIATSAARLPRQVSVPPSEPSPRLSIFAAVPTAKRDAAQINQGLQKLSEAGYPVTTISTQEKSRSLTDSQREELARWIDSLDRF
jgi:serine protease Do